jgi:ribose transport system substrate-binding protein
MKLHRMKWGAGLAAVTACLLAVSGCSSGSGDTGGSGSSQLDDAALTKFVDAAKKGEQPTTWPGPDSLAAPVKGKRIAVVLCASTAEGCVRIGKGVEEAAAKLGWTVKSYDGQGQASVQTQAMRQAVTDKVDGIVLAAIDAHTVGQGMNAARSAGIPVVSAVGGNTSGTGEGDVFAEPSAQPETAGANLANWLVSQTKGDLKVAMFHAPEFTDSVKRYNGSKQVIDSCSTCKMVSDTTYTASTAAQRIPLETKSILQAHPDINYVWIDIGGIGGAQVQAIAEANLASKVKLVSFDCNLLDLENIRKNNVQVACEGLGLEAGGWGALAQLNQAFNNQPAVQTYVPIRTLTADSLPAAGQAWQGDYDFRAKYAQLWNLG